MRSTGPSVRVVAVLHTALRTCVRRYTKYVQDVVGGYAGIRDALGAVTWDYRPCLEVPALRSNIITGKVTHTPACQSWLTRFFRQSSPTTRLAYTFARSIDHSTSVASVSPEWQSRHQRPGGPKQEAPGQVGPARPGRVAGYGYGYGYGYLMAIDMSMGQA